MKQGHCVVVHTNLDMWVEEHCAADGARCYPQRERRSATDYPEKDVFEAAADAFLGRPDVSHRGRGNRKRRAAAGRRGCRWHRARRTGGRHGHGVARCGGNAAQVPPQAGPDLARRRPGEPGQRIRVRRGWVAAAQRLGAHRARRAGRCCTIGHTRNRRCSWTPGRPQPGCNWRT